MLGISPVRSAAPTPAPASVYNDLEITIPSNERSAAPTPAPASVYNDLEITISSNETSPQELLRIIERLQTETKSTNNNSHIRKLTSIIQSLIEHEKTPKTNETSKSIKTIIAQILTTTNPGTRVSEVDYLTQKLFPIEKSIFETNNTSRFKNCDFSLNQWLATFYCWVTYDS